MYQRKLTVVEMIGDRLVAEYPNVYLKPSLLVKDERISVQALNQEHSLIVKIVEPMSAVEKAEIIECDWETHLRQRRRIVKWSNLRCMNWENMGSVSPQNILTKLSIGRIAAYIASSYDDQIDEHNNGLGGIFEFGFALLK